VVPESWMGLSAWRARAKVFVSGRTEGPTRACPLCIVCEIQAEAQPESWTGLGLSRTREVFGGRKDEETWFSPRILADMSAALVETEENWNRRPGNSLRVMPPGETSSTVPAISSTGLVKCLSFMRMTDSRVFLTRVRIFSYSISSSVFPCACLPTICRKVLYSRE
jgi:hypothetical protein